MLTATPGRSLIAGAGQDVTPDSSIVNTGKIMFEPSASTAGGSAREIAIYRSAATTGVRLLIGNSSIPGITVSWMSDPFDIPAGTGWVTIPFTATIPGGLFGLHVPEAAWHRWCASAATPSGIYHWLGTPSISSFHAWEDSSYHAGRLAIGVYA